MGVLGKFGPAALKYYGSILTSAYQHLNVSDMWDAIHQVQANYGLPTAQASGADVMVIRGFANRIVNGARNLAAASESDTITADMMAVAPYTMRDRNAIAVSPVYHVRFLNTVQADDGTVTQTWQTSVFTAPDMPGTVGDLKDTINANATELAAQGGAADSNTPRGVSVTTSDYEITLV